MYLKIQSTMSPVHDQVYIHTLVVALSCVPTALWVGLTINIVGKKLMLGEWGSFHGAQFLSKFSGRMRGDMLQ